MWLIKLFALSTILTAFADDSLNINKSSKNKFIIGGLFPVHSKGTSDLQPCGAILPEKGIQRLEAMWFAIDEINKNFGKWKFTLDAMILDTCSSDSYALEESLKFLHGTCESTSSKGKVTAIVGASNSAVSESVANIFRMFKIPQVSYASTSEELDDLHKYPYFFRVVPSDKFQVRVILDLLIYFKWSYVSAVVSEGDYGQQAIKSLQELASNVTTMEICFAKVCVLPRDASEKYYEAAVESLLQHEKSNVVIVFLNEDKIRHLFTAVRKSEVPKNRFLWLGSDGWGAKINPVRGNEEFAEGAFTIMPKRYPVKACFNEYFKSLKPKSNSRNPWFKEFWENQFNCTYDELQTDLTPCTDEEELGDYDQEGLVPMVIDSVYLIATAIKSLCQDMPDLCHFAIYKDAQFRKFLKDYILKVQLNSSQGNGMLIRFDSQRNIPPHYKIYQYQKSSGNKFFYREIGDWSQRNYTNLRIAENIFWRGNKSLPRSTCSDECAVGEERILSRNTKKHCCWTCKPCDDETYLPDVMGHCVPCESGYIPSEDGISCKPLELDYIGRDLRSPWALVPFCFAIFGLVFTFVVFLVFIFYNKTPIIMASGRELCYVILLGVALCYSFTFVALLKPSKLTCGALRTGMGLGLSVCYSAIFTKTNRISRIFNRSIRICKRPSYISPESQLVICSCLILIQVILTVMWLIVTPPTVKNLIMKDPRAYVMICGFDGISVILALLYNMVLISLCTYYAYKTRNIPENFNESKYISFTMYASCIAWLAFIPIYYSSNHAYKVQATVLCMNVSISGSVTLACLFLPKIYIVLFHPEKNVRYPSSSPNSSTPTICISPVRFLRSNQNSPATPHQSKVGSDELSCSDNFME